MKTRKTVKNKELTSVRYLQLLSIRREKMVMNLKLTFASLGIASSLFLSPGVAFAGNGDGGGGNLTTPSFDEVSAQAKLALNDVKEQFAWLSNNLNRVKDPELRGFLKNMITGERTKVTVSEDIDGTNFEWQLLHPCRGQEGETEAAVASNKTMATICLSLPLLSKHPVANLRATLRTLLAHEISHHYQADEAMAKKVEAFFGGWISKPSAAGGAQNVNALTKQEIQILLARLKDGAVSRTRLCTHIGKIMGFRAAYHDIMLALVVAQQTLGDDYGVDEDKTNAFFKNYFKPQLIEKLQCDSADQGDESVSENTRKALLLELESLGAEVRSLETAAPDRYRNVEAGAAR